MAQSMRATLQKTAEGFLISLGTRDLDIITSNYTEDFTQSVLPASIGKAPVGKEEFRTSEFTTAFFAFMDDLVFTIKTIVIDVETRKVSIYAHGGGKHKTGTYTNEFAFFLEMSEDGKRIRSVQEFMDVDSARKLIGELVAYTESQK
ncbi:hypothetical protein PVAG01_00630 [Phlyctema vagabunda]|uniref:SnoaL-like domain-containing protein n=1 Tax=Phlyctema vagabunda TaxID=108571 RepID=A0ABR4PV46_9HELO